MDEGLLILRIVVGLLFFGHGAQKLFGWFGGYGLQGSRGFFESLGYRPGHVMAGLAGAAELSAGVLLVAGFLTPLASAAIIGVMLNAVFTAKRQAGLWNGYELDLVYATAATALAFTGAGLYSVDGWLGLGLAGVTVGLAAVAVGLVVGGITLVTRRTAPAIRETELRRAA